MVWRGASGTGDGSWNSLHDLLGWMCTRKRKRGPIPTFHGFAVVADIICHGQNMGRGTEHGAWREWTRAHTRRVGAIQRNGWR